MDYKEAALLRHTVREYKKNEIDLKIVELINKKISSINIKYNLSMELITNDKKGLSFIAKMFLGKGVKNYIILSGNKFDLLDETLGYVGSDIILYCQTLGLNTWWIGSTYNTNLKKQTNNKEVIGIIVIGYGKNQGKQHKSKEFDDVAKYDNAPNWFIQGVEYALLAPTALNKQDFMITGNGNIVEIICEKSIYANINLGIIKYFFELGANKSNFIYK